MTDDLLNSEAGQVPLIVKSVNNITIFKYQCLILYSTVQIRRTSVTIFANHVFTSIGHCTYIT